MAAAAGAEPLARWLAGARHHPRPVLQRPTIVVVAADHGVVDPGPGLGAGHPTAVVLDAIARGDAALVPAAAGAGARVVVLDAGVAVPAPGTIEVVPWRATADLVSRAAMTPAMAIAALEGGIAAGTAIIEDGADLLVLAAVGVGGDLAAAALIAALTGDDDAAAASDDRALIAAALARGRGAGARPLTTPAGALIALAELGGGVLGALAGRVLTAAALHVPVVLDGVVATAGALLAATLVPAVRGYLLAAHAGGGPGATRARAALGLTPLVGFGLGRGDGAGGALIQPLLRATTAA